MILSENQREIISRICDLQEESLLDIYQNHMSQIYDEMDDDEYDVDEEDVVERVIQELKTWDKLKIEPHKFFELLDDDNIGMVRHHLFNEHYNEDTAQLDQAAKELWRKLNLNDNVRKFNN